MRLCTVYRTRHLICVLTCLRFTESSDVVRGVALGGAENSGPENARLENDGQKCRAGLTARSSALSRQMQRVW